MEPMKDYSIGKGRVVYAYYGSAEEAFQDHDRLALSRRLGVFEWDAEKSDDGGIRISNPRRLPWPKRK